MGGVLSNVGAIVNSERGCDGNVVDREEAEEEAPFKR